jgi:hypothetical protein
MLYRTYTSIPSLIPVRGYVRSCYKIIGLDFLNTVNILPSAFYKDCSALLQRGTTSDIEHELLY